MKFSLEAKIEMKLLRASIAACLVQTKREERNWRGHPIHTTLYNERQRTTRPGMRALNLAYGFMRGRTLRQVENDAQSRPKWDQVEEHLLSYVEFTDHPEIKQRFTAWIAEAKLPKEVAPGLPKSSPIYNLGKWTDSVAKTVKNTSMGI